MSTPATARFLDELEDAELDLRVRTRAAKRLGSASDDLELQAFDTLKRIACDAESPESLGRAAGIGFARPGRIVSLQRDWRRGATWN